MMEDMKLGSLAPGTQKGIWTPQWRCARLHGSSTRSLACEPPQAVRMDHAQYASPQLAASQSMEAFQSLAKRRTAV